MDFWPLTTSFSDGRDFTNVDVLKINQNTVVCTTLLLRIDHKCLRCEKYTTCESYEIGK